MEQKYLIISLTIAILIVSATIFFMFSSKTSLSPPIPKNLECKTHIFSSESGINILFFSESGSIDKYISSILSTSPIKENKEKFNFHYIDSYSPECELYKDVAIFCYSKSLIKAASSCPADYIVVLNNENPRSIRSSAYQNILSLNEKHPLSVFQHEFGHAFANLAEEYVPAKTLKGSENCVSTCDEFNGLEEGCFQGCSSSNSYRSIESGVMRTLSSSNFGSYNEYLIQEQIDLQFSSKDSGSDSFAVSLSPEEISDSKCLEERFFLLTLGKDKSILDKEVISGCPTNLISEEGDLSIIISSANSNSLETSLDSATIFTDVELETKLTGDIFEYEEEIYIPIPIIDESQEIEIYHHGELIDSTKLNPSEYYPCKK